MARKYDRIRSSALKDTAEFMCVAARTAPKTRGRDNLIITILAGKEISSLIATMKKIGKRESRPSFSRDAQSMKDIEYVVLIATAKDTLGLNCGFCGYKNCLALSRTSGICAYNSMDLGIALGSAAAVAGNLHVDNRLMFSIGKAALETGILGKKAVQAIGIPLSGTGKNPFFDRQ